jgi:hypothetical protein
MKSNFNTVLLACLLGVCGWGAKTTFDMSRELSTLSADLRASDRRVAAFDIDLNELRARITQCEIDLARIKRSN